MRDITLAQAAASDTKAILTAKMNYRNDTAYLPPFSSLTCCGTHRACAGRPSLPAPAWLGQMPAPAFAGG